MKGIGAKPLQAKKQQKPYPPGEGEGCIGQFRWLVREDVKRPRLGDRAFTILPEPQEDMVEAEVFNGTDYVPYSAPGDRLLKDEEEEILQQDSRSITHRVVKD